jgi:hypothetical protein
MAVTGIIKLYINGELQNTVEDPAITLGGKKRELIKGHKVYGPKESIEPGAVKFKIAHMSDTDLISLTNLSGATIKYECDTGTSYLITNGCTTELLELSGGMVDVEIQGDPAEEE